MRTIYLSAGHSNVAGRDRGAIGNGFIEGELTVELRQLIVSELRKLGVNPIVDDNNSILSQTLNKFRNMTTNRCIVLDIHWNASANVSATGTETLVDNNPTQFELDLAQQLSQVVHNVLNIPLRGNFRGRPGVRSERESHHGSLGWMRLTGENVLMEIGFISNTNDMRQYQLNKHTLAKQIAQTLFNFANDRKTIPGKTNNEPQRITHTVVSGDTLSGIARRYNTTVANLRTLNNLTSDVIRIGQILRIN
jgi:N-acetylmuramoyl-L-alanine amidase